MEEPISMPPALTGPRFPMTREVMIDQPIPMPSVRRVTPAPSLRDFITVIFRHRVLIAGSFAAIFFGVVLGTWIMPKQYESSMKILVKRERADPIVTTESTSQPDAMREITQEDLNSEVELLKSRDLLEKVVISCGLHTLKKSTFFSGILGSQAVETEKPSGPDMRIPQAVEELEKNLVVEPIAKSKMFEVRYRAHDPNLAAKVLQTLSGLYLEKHLAVHRPPGALDFFQHQTQQYQKELEGAEKQLSVFSAKEGVVSVEIEKDMALRRLGDFEAQLRETQAAQAAVEERIESLKAQAAATPARVTTQVKTSSNAALLEQLRSTLLTLELSRTELLTKFEPGYRAVQEVDTKIAQARSALQDAEKNSLRDETTDLDRTRQWLDEELSRTRTEAATLKARSIEIAKIVEAYRQNARQIGQAETRHTDLIRAIKTAEANYLLYLRKQEEARISDELDRKRIVNVAIAEAATVPALPSSPKWPLNLALGFVLACLTSLGLAFVVDNLDATFRTPDEVESLLGIPVVASLPRS